MHITCKKILLLTALVSTALFVLSGISAADLIEPNLPEKHVAKRLPQHELPVLELLQNPDLPNREGVKIANIKVHSAGKVIEQFDSNVFLADTDVQYDFITILSPSIGVDMKAGDSRLAADYEVGQYLYGIWHDQNHLDHRARLSADTRINDYKISVTDEFRIFTDRAANENSLRLKESTNNLKTGVAAEFNKFTFDVGYINKIQAYDSQDLMLGDLPYSARDYMDQSVYTTLSYRVRPKTYLIFENDIGYINYYESSQVPDSFYDDILCGLRGDWSSKIIMNLRAGFRYQGYESSPVIAHKPYIGPIIRGGLQYNPTEDDAVFFTLERADYESTYATNNYYTLNLIGVEYRHKFSNKVSGGLFGSYQLHLYPSETTENGVTAKRYDNLLNGGFSIRYDIKRWISIELRYEYRQKMSIFDIFDYIDNLVSVRGTIGF